MKSTPSSDFDLLLLSKNEHDILQILKAKKHSTPAALAKLCPIPRPTIYITLDKLKMRGLVTVRKQNKRKIWEVAETQSVKEDIDNLKNKLIPDTGTYNTLQITDTTDITIHQGGDAILNLFLKFANTHNGRRLMGMSGNRSVAAWKDAVSIKDINAINHKIKTQGLISEIITSEDWFKDQVKIFGLSWAENFIGRTAQVHFIDNMYLDFESQIFIFGNELYLVSMRERLFIEIKNRQIANLLIALLKFVEDNTRTVNINQILKDMLPK